MIIPTNLIKTSIYFQRKFFCSDNESVTESIIFPENEVISQESSQKNGLETIKKPKAISIPKPLKTLQETKQAYENVSKKYSKNILNKVNKIVEVPEEELLPDSPYYKDLWNITNVPETGVILDIEIKVDRTNFSLNTQKSYFHETLVNMFIINESTLKSIKKYYDFFSPTARPYNVTKRPGKDSTRSFLLHLENFSIDKGNEILTNFNRSVDSVKIKLIMLKNEAEKMPPGPDNVDNIRAKFKSIIDAFLREMKEVIMLIDALEMPIVIAAKVNQHKRDLLKTVFDAMRILPLFQYHFTHKKRTLLFNSVIQEKIPETKLALSAKPKKAKKKKAD